MLFVRSSFSVFKRIFYSCPVSIIGAEELLCL